MRSRSWRWLRGRILGLLNQPITFVPIRSETGYRLLPMYRTRLQAALAPPSDEAADAQ